ncbi:hypothetical protein GQ457_16G026040 [Hibiscus cannabinus]
MAQFPVEPVVYYGGPAYGTKGKRRDAKPPFIKPGLNPTFSANKHPSKFNFLEKMIHFGQAPLLSRNQPHSLRDGVLLLSLISNPMSNRFVCSN